MNTKQLHKLALLLGLILLSAKLWAQEKLEMKLILQDSTSVSNKFIKKINKSYNAKDSFALVEIAKQVQQKAINSGFVAASYQIKNTAEGQFTMLLHAGMQYKWVQLKINPLYRDIFLKAGYKKVDYTNSSIKFTKLERIFEKVLVSCENRGYPFASIALDSVSINENEVNAIANLQLNKYIIIDSIIIKGDSKISPYFLNNYLGIKEGMPYQEAKIAAINNRLKELPYLKQIKPYEYTFTPKLSKLVLYLERKKANQFDGVLGFLPSEKTGKIEFTGQAHLRLQNVLNRGELLDIDWRKLQLNSRDIKAKVTYPYLFRSPLGIDLNFKLFQRDTLFVDITQNLGLQYLLGGTNFLKVFVNNRTLNLVSTIGLEQLSKLPEYADVKTITYGIGAKFEQTDYRLNPRKGYQLMVNASTGTKSIIKNAKINEVLYKDLNLKSSLYLLDGQVDFYIPIARQSTLNIGAKTAAISAANIFLNEAYRIGGNSTLRGFDEESIYATTYCIGNLEYRYLFEQNSFLFFFVNGAWYELNTKPSYQNDTPYGFGTGVSFQTKAGIFSISYALGKQLSNPILLRTAKVHFGIISIF